MSLRGVSAILVLVLASGRLASGTDDSAKVAAAQSAVLEWAALMDQGRYEDCWNSLAESTKAKMPKAQWLVYINGVRKPMGVLKARKQTKAEYVPSLKNLPDQDGAIIAFQSSFESRSSVLETFGVIHEKDGQWRVGHYLTN